MPARCFMKAMLCLFALTALPAGASAQQLVAKKYADVGGWTIESYKVDGRYMRCGAVAPAMPARRTSFEKSREGWTVVLPTKAKGDSVQGSVAIDGRTFRGPFYRMDDDRVGLFLKQGQLRLLRASMAMSIRIGGEQTRVSLAGAASALGKLSECDKKGGA
ncbi:hypothetical protein PY365_29585 [Roseiarcaceae bacterium H3SJ34-1]|uniref:hypothetical protein n=1 Tax=Terripilifer ovatus TaxID=3032367 RepID=UPI003AB9360B|nr:hypothetical protein [Roseiarcaceae bacterium H3SJ34-1]